jgi:hypothetical protein
MATQRAGRRGMVWAVAGGLILLAGIVAIVVSALMSAAPESSRSPSATPSGPEPSSTAEPTDPGSNPVVDATVIDKGWIPEPITADPETYVRAALAAASTFDTTRSTRDEWMTFLDSWFTPDTRYSSPDEQVEAMEASQLELRQGVVLPEAEWDSLANEDGRVSAATVGEVALSGVPNDASGDMSIGTADVTLTFTRVDGNGDEVSYEETVRVSTQVLCGAASVPTPNTDQQAGDCKIVRYFTEPVEL